MARKKTAEKQVEEHNEIIATDKEYSLVVDPQGEYKWTAKQKKFLEIYIQTKSVKLACTIAQMNEVDASVFLTSYNAQKEIRRINMAMVQHQFQNKMATLDDIGGYLTSLLQGNVLQGEQLSFADKKDVINLLIKVHQTKIDAVKEPQTIITRDLNVDFSKLSVKSLKTLIDNYNSQDIDTIMSSSLSPEEIANLKSQGQEIAEIVNIINKE